MQDYPDQVERLLSLGLTKYQARAYIALLDLGETKASRIAHLSGVPRGRIYEVLEGLQAAGLVEFLPSVPRGYRAIPLHHFLERKKKALRAEAEQLERSMGTLTSQFTPRQPKSSEAAGEFLVYRKRRAVMAKMREMIEGATTEVHVTSSEGDAIRARGALLDAYQERAGAGVNIQLSCNITRHNLAALKTLESAVQIRHQDTGTEAVTIMVVDEAQALFCHWTPDEGELFGGDHAAIWSDDIGVVRSLRSIVDEAWERGVEASLRYLEIETGVPQRADLVAGDWLKASILDCIEVGLVVVDNEGKFLHFNRAGANILGIGVTSAAPSEWPERYGAFRPDEATPFPAEETPVVLALNGQTTREVPMFVRNPQRPEGVHILTTSRPLRDAKGKVQGAVTVFTDITELRKAEDALRQSETQLRLIVEQMPAVLWTTDTELRFTSSLGLGLTALNLESNQAVGMNLFEYFQTEDSQFLPIAMHIRTLRGESVSYETEWEGTLYASHLEPLHDEGGNIVGTVGVALDVTERKRADEELRESEAKYRDLFEAAPLGIFEGDLSKVHIALEDLRKKGITDIREYLKTRPGFLHELVGMVDILDVNSAALSVTGAENKDELLAGLQGIFIPETMKAFEEIMVTLWEGGTHYQGVSLFSTFQGIRIPVILSLTVTGNPPDYRRVMVTVIDITELKQVEEELTIASTDLEDAKPRRRPRGKIPTG